MTLKFEGVLTIFDAAQYSYFVDEQTYRWSCPESTERLERCVNSEISIFCRKIAISPQPNIRWTWDQSVNSSLSVVIQKNISLYLSWFNHGSTTKFENASFQITKLRFSKNFAYQFQYQAKTHSTTHLYPICKWKSFEID